MQNYWGQVWFGRLNIKYLCHNFFNQMEMEGRRQIEVTINPFSKRSSPQKRKKNQCLIFLFNIIVWLAATSSAQVAGLFFSILMHQRLERTDRFLWFELLQSCWVSHGFSVMCQSKSNPLEEIFFFSESKRNYWTWNDAINLFDI